MKLPGVGKILPGERMKLPIVRNKLPGERMKLPIVGKKLPSVRMKLPGEIFFDLFLSFGARFQRYDWGFLSRFDEINRYKMEKEDYDAHQQSVFEGYRRRP